jgi:hypothetical protein
MITSRLVISTGSSSRTLAVMSTEEKTGPAVSTAYSNGRRGPGRATPASARMTCPLVKRHFDGVTGAQLVGRMVSATRVVPAEAAAKVRVPVTFQILPLALARM